MTQPPPAPMSESVRIATDAIAQRLAMCFRRGGDVPAMTISKLQRRP